MIRVVCDMRNLLFFLRILLNEVAAQSPIFSEGKMWYQNPVVQRSSHHGTMKVSQISLANAGGERSVSVKSACCT